MRLFWTRRKLLEWETAASTDRRLQGGLLDTFADMWAGPALAIVTGPLVWRDTTGGAAGGRTVSGGLAPFASRRFSSQPAEAIAGDRPE